MRNEENVDHIVRTITSILLTYKISTYLLIHHSSSEAGKHTKKKILFLINNNSIINYLLTCINYFKSGLCFMERFAKVVQKILGKKLRDKL